MPQAATSISAWARSPVPKTAPPKPSVKTCVAATRAIAKLRIIHTRCLANSRRRTARYPRSRVTTSATPNISRSGYTMPRVACARGKNWFSHSAVSATPSPATTTTRPALRCQTRPCCRRRGTNWKAPTSANTMALTMCTTTGQGDASNRGFGGSFAAPPDNSTRRSEPAITGMVTSAIRAAGTGQLRWEPAGFGVRVVIGLRGPERRRARGRTGGGGAAGLDGGRRPLAAPEGDAEPDHGDGVREGEQPVEGVRHQREHDTRESADGEEQRRPAGEDLGPEERDAEDQAAGEVEARLDLSPGDGQSSEVAGHGAAARGQGDDVLDVGR